MNNNQLKTVIREFLSSDKGSPVIGDKYKNQFLEDVFVTKIGESTKAISVSPGEYLIGVVRKNQKSKFNTEEVVQVKKKAVEMLATDIMSEYNQYLQKKYPIEVNEKFFGKKS